MRLLELLQGTGIETHLIMSRAAQVTLAHETDLKVADVEKLATVVHSNSDIGAACSSGSFRTLGMVIAPCSIKTMAEIATGATGHLLSRAADVALKERRRVVLVLRETPLHLGHIRSMAAVTEAGAIVYPPVPAMYARPKSIEEMVDHTLGRVLDLFDIDMGLVRRWTGDKSRPQESAQRKKIRAGAKGTRARARLTGHGSPLPAISTTRSGNSRSPSMRRRASPTNAWRCRKAHGVDVNVLLFCAWLAVARKVALAPGKISTPSALRWAHGTRARSGRCAACGAT